MGFHINQAYKQFRAGHTLSDLRTALQVAQREQAETESLTRDEVDAPVHRVLRFSTIASATWLAATIGLGMLGVIHENRGHQIWWFLSPVFTTMGLGAVSNALDVQFIPEKLRQSWRSGIRGSPLEQPPGGMARETDGRTGTFAARRRVGVPGDGSGVRRCGVGTLRGAAEGLPRAAG